MLNTEVEKAKRNVGRKSMYFFLFRRSGNRKTFHFILEYQGEPRVCQETRSVYCKTPQKKGQIQELDGEKICPIGPIQELDEKTICPINYF